MRYLLVPALFVALWYVARRASSAAQRVTSPAPANAWVPVLADCLEGCGRVQQTVHGTCGTCGSHFVRTLGFGRPVGVSSHA